MKSFMMSFKKTIALSFLGALLCAAAVTAVWRAHPIPPEPQAIKIGAILSLSGDFASFGEAIHQGALLALAEAQERGEHVAFVSEDDHSTAVGAVNAANKLVHIDAVDGALTATVQEVKPIAPLFNATRIPLLATWDSNAYIKTAGESIFTIGFSTEDAGDRMAQHAFEKLGVRRVAVIWQQDEWSGVIAGAFNKKFRALDGKVVFEEEVIPTARDYRTSIAKIKNAHPDGVYLPFLPSTISPFLTQAKQLGLKAVFMTGDSMSTDEVAQTGDAAENVYFTNLYADNAKTIVEKYRVRYGKEPGDPIFVSFGYDGMRTLLAAARIARERRIAMDAALRMADIQGTDARITFSGKQYAEKYERLYNVEHGQFVEVR